MFERKSEMERQYKHFTHIHNLTIHQIPQGTEITCSGCNFSGTATVYVCWQCDFFLHDQCFHATQSLQHPSHPSHPLTLLPFPTYPSNSFYCNSCSQLGTGFTYCCSDCEFDLHVKCAYSISLPSNLIPDSNMLPHQIPPPKQAQSLNVQPKVLIPTSSPSRGDKLKTQGIMHFSHPHVLHQVSPETEDDSTECSICMEVISESRYSCSKRSCDFHLDKSCLQLAQVIQHKSHPEHPLTHFPSPYDSGQFSCNGCQNDGVGYSYHCATCKFDLHIQCASLQETVKRDDHGHTLKLFYSCPNKELNYSCDACHGTIHEDCWAYYCEKCDYSYHVDCVNCEESEVEERESSTGNPVLDAQIQKQRLQFKMQIARQNAQFMISCGQSLVNLTR